MSIAPETLLGLVRNTAPFIFETAFPDGAGSSYLRLLQAARDPSPPPAAYYHLCLAAHWATAGTYVPTDVDNAIRHKLWQEASPQDTEAMVDLVLAALRWDYSYVTARVARSPSGQIVSTHEGTWFSVAVGAYAAAKRARSAKAEEVLAAMVAEAEREAGLFRELCEAEDGLGTLKASALLAHNFGDLDRVADQWQLPKDDPLVRSLYDAASPDSKLFAGWPAHAGKVNQRFMAPENHRHYALRKPRCLRRAAQFLLPVGPFFDDWGAAVAGGLPAEDVGEVVRALLDGLPRLPGTVGYARALAGIQERFPGGFEELRRVITAKDARELRAGPLRALCSVSKERFEAQWSKSVRTSARAAV